MVAGFQRGSGGGDREEIDDLGWGHSRKERGVFRACGAPGLIFQEFSQATAGFPGRVRGVLEGAKFSGAERESSRTPRS
jgi:hypothetical protein